MEELADSSNSSKGKNASIYYSIIKTDTYFHLAKLLIQQTIILLSLFQSIVHFQLTAIKRFFQCSNCQEEMKNKQKLCIH